MAGFEVFHGMARTLMLGHAYLAPNGTPSRQGSGYRDMRMSLGGMKRPAVMMLSCLAFAAAAAGAGAQQVQYISAIVNDEVISAHDIEERLRLVLASAQVPDTPEIRRRLRDQVLRGLVDEMLQVQEAKRLNIRLTSQEIDRAITRVAKGNKTTADGLAAFLAARNIGLGTLLTRLRAELIWTKLLALRFAGTIQVGDDEVDEVIARLNANKGKPEYRISEIFLAVNTPDEEEEVRRNAVRLADEARRGAPFEAIAEQFSQAATAALGGEVGWLQPGQLGAEMEAALQTMSAGDISNPIRAQGGYFVIKLHDRRKILVDAPHDATVSLKQILIPLEKGASPEEVNRRRQLAAAIASAVRGCADFDAIARERNTPGSGDQGMIRIGDLAPKIRDAVAPLEIGQPSAPIERPSDILVLMVCERSGAKTSIPSRDEIRDNLMQQQLTLMARRYLRDLRRDAVIELR